MNGVVYYNYGKSMIVRLVCSLSSLRRVYDGPVHLFSEGKESHEICKKLSGPYDVEVIEVDFGKMYRRKVYLNACLVSQNSKFDNCVWIDADTLVLKHFCEMFEEAENNDFVISQFSNWTTKKGVIHRRILGWKDVYPKEVEKAVKFGPAINCGVFAFNKRSTLVKDWFEFAEKGKDKFIPDEVGCQIMLPNHRHKILGNEFNTSCRFGNIEKAKIIHFHGRKHCRIECGKFLNKSNLWYDEFEKVRHLDIVKDNIQFDKMLRANLASYEGIK